tara:strand:- start:2821 stop:4596 length:1776 start_codon:yes stop_codon:yes gene_type:complete
MKWIGQHIWDFISRFRNDVYLEDLTESAQDHVVGIDTNGKLYKQDVSTGDITSVTAGDALTGGGTSGAVTINHEDTSSQASVDNSGSTFIQDVTLDTYGHVTGLTSVAVPTLNQNTTGQAGTVATITGLAPDTATTQATQPNITTMTGFLGGTANALITDDGDGTVTSESSLIYTTSFGTALTMSSVLPVININNTNNDSGGGALRLQNLRGSGGHNPLSINDKLGTIQFSGGDSLGTFTNYAMIYGDVRSSTNTDEAGRLYLQVATSDGTTTALQNGLLLTGDPTGNKIDVDLGNGGTSTTTIAGTLTMGTTAAMTNAGLLSVAAQTNITSLGTLTNLQVDDVNINSNIIGNVGGDLSVLSSGDLFLSGATNVVVQAGRLDISGTSASAGHVNLYEDTDNGTNAIKLIGPTSCSDQTITLPDATGTVALTDTARSFINLRQDDLYIQFMSQQNRWYGTRAGTSIGTGSTLDGVGINNRVAILNSGFTATRNCTLHRVQITFYPSQTHDLEFEILKIPFVNDSTSLITAAKMTHTDCDGSYTANRNYTKTFTITGGNTLTAGQGIIFALRRTTAGSTPFINGMLIGEIEMT